MRAEISDQQWQLLRDTGVVHLISVSGLHLGMVAILVYAIARSIAALAVLRHPQFPTFGVAACGALTIAAAYALLTGFSIPTQRTLIMVAIGFWAKTRANAVLSIDSLLIAAALLLTLNPLTGLSVSFWFSFGTLALVLYLGHVRPRFAGWRAWVSNHCWLALLLAPITGFAFQSLSLTSPVANAVAIPLVTLLIVPLLLLGIALNPWFASLSDACWAMAASCWQLLVRFLALLAELVGPINLPVLPSSLVFLASLVAMLLLLSPFRAMRVFLVPSLLLMLAAPRTAPLAAGEFQLDILDVGQGLSVIISTARHTLVYDAGARFPAGGDIGAQVVVPFLKAIGRQRVDELLISHGDNDHAGGAASVFAALRVGVVTAPRGVFAQRLPNPCVAGRTWQWDGVEFQTLHPAPRQGGDKNNLSCVVRIRGTHGTALLTGDIEGEAERALLASKVDLGAEILLVRHHGSKSSSTSAFLAAVAPRYALVSAGYRNRFGHPAETVRTAYRRRGTELFSTVELGAITVRIDDTLERPHGVRERQRRYWDP